MNTSKTSSYTWTTLAIVWLLILLSGLLLLSCSTILSVHYLLRIYGPRPGPQPVPTLTREPTSTLPPSPSPESAPVLPLAPTPTPAPRHTTATPDLSEIILPDEPGAITLLEAEHIPIPTRDLRVLGMRFHPELGDIPRIVNPTPPTYHVGDEKEFWASNTDEHRHFKVTAVLKHITPHAYFWVEKGARVDMDELKEAAEVFEEHIYPTDRRVFGTEWEPGVDNDPHITFLHVRNLGRQIAGYFSSEQSYPREVSPYSNEMDMFYINLDTTEPGDPFYYQVIAHEFQHMIHWHQDRNEETWLNEGFSVLAEVINGYALGLHVNTFLSQPDLQLTAWSEDDATPHYGAAGLFAYYMYERLGEDFIRRVARHPENGMTSIDAVLHEPDIQGEGVPPDVYALFADWVVANWANDPDSNDGYFGYHEEIRTKARAQKKVDAFPSLITDSVAQYGTDYIQLKGKGPVTLHFQGEPVSRVAPLSPHSGRFVMWSNRGDESDTRLYTQVDLTQAKEASLQFWTWYDIEEDYDYAYVIVSTDGGEHWQLLQSDAMTSANPFGNNLGVGFTGVSGGGERPRWIQQEVDLTPYVGREILVGFEYVTDDAFTRPGFFVDDVRIAAAGLDEDFEGPLRNWTQEGFIRTDTFVPQKYLVQVIQKKKHHILVRPFINKGGDPLLLDISDIGWGDTVIAISGLAPLTWESAPYTLSLGKGE